MHLDQNASYNLRYGVTIDKKTWEIINLALTVSVQSD